MSLLSAAFELNDYHPALCARCGHDHGGAACPLIPTHIGRTTP